MTHSALYDYCQTQGPLTVDAFFRLCMYHPEWGYYHRKVPIGTTGDYVTAPEMSQVFGELIGLWCMDIWQKLNQPPVLALVELGPGKGTMMADIIRISHLLPNFAQALQIHLVEKSPQLRLIQQQRLSSKHPTWHQDLTTLPQIPTIFIANEFFDALPHKQFEAHNNQWYERLIGCDHQKFFWTKAEAPTDLSYEAIPQAIMEIPQEGTSILEHMSAHLSHVQGAALIIDYGDDLNPGFGDTLQALYCHQRCSPFDHPGISDLTFHVNFHHIKQIFQKAQMAPVLLTTQGNFLKHMGVMERTEQLARKNSNAALASFRLISAQHMGQLFKVLGVCSPNLQLIGFA